MQDQRRRGLPLLGQGAQRPSLTQAIDPQRSGVMATASTLAQFCRRFPRSTARIFTPDEQRQAKTVGLIVLMPALTARSCQSIRGGA